MSAVLDARQKTDAPPAGIEGPIGYVLLAGVVASVALLLGGLVWHRLSEGSLRLHYSLGPTNLFQFLVSDARQVASGTLRPRDLINLGIAVLLLTPYVRVLASVLYFAFVERNVKYTVFTAVVLLVLTYSLFLR